ncbi:MAG: hypothetical protein QW412_01660 [Candidatus Aenigmatarchaeota archaeon]
MQAQVSIERISVYGWALALILSTIFILYTMGLTKPCKFTGTQISGFANFMVSEVKMNLSEGKNIMSLKLTNNMETAIEIEENGIEMVKGDLKGSSLNSPLIIKSYESRDFLIEQSSGISFSKGECYDVEIIINYKQKETKHQSKGRIYGVVDS